MTDTTIAPPSRAHRGKGAVLAWGLWDWGSAAFNAVITTFVFTVYITSDSFGDGASVKLGWALAIAGLVIALVAPITGRRADKAGRRTFWLTVNTAVVAAVSFGLFFIEPDQSFLIWGLLLLAIGNIFFEFASVQYNAMINEISTPATVGRISGLGWGLGYIGGIVLLLIVYFGFIDPDVGLFGVTDANGMDVRVSMLLCGIWTVLFSLPVILTIRDDKSTRSARGPRRGVLESIRAGIVSVGVSYRELFHTIRTLWNHDRNTAYFLLSSAIFRDGLAGVFTFGGVLAAGWFGFSPGDVIKFAVAANVVAGIATVSLGVLDDIFGPKRVIMASLGSMVVLGTLVFFFHDGGAQAFWILGLALCVFVGPAQSASRTFLARLIPEGREGELFGLYATTGRAVSFMAPAAFSGMILLGAAVTGADNLDDVQYWGIIGIVLLLLIGLLVLLPVKSRLNKESALIS